MSMERGDYQIKLLLARVEELCDRAAHGRFCCTNFLTPREQRYATELLRRRGESGRVRLHGGYAAAERACLLFFPDYVVDAYEEAAFASCPIGELLAIAGEDDPVAAIAVRAGGYRTLSHRDYLGSLLSLGLEREVLGDLELPDTHSAYLFCRTTMAPFIEESLERVGGDKITVQRVQPDESFVSLRRTQPLSDTVASARLDCVVAALANLSRESAQQLIREGRVELDYRMEERVDRTVATPATVSVRGVGKFRVISIGTQTKKGRFRLLAEKYI
jgi:RNA-binding protein YlmH